MSAESSTHQSYAVLRNVGSIYHTMSRIYFDLGVNTSESGQALIGEVSRVIDDVLAL